MNSDKRKIIRLKTIDSTNVYLINAVRNGELDVGDCVIADKQSCGRGRHGKSFLSPFGGIYMSFCVNNIKDGLATVICGVAVADCLAALGIKPEIKWVNDILIDGKKVCGILAQSVGDGSRAIIGIGINVHYSDISGEISDIATALDAHCDLKSTENLPIKIIERYEELSDFLNYNKKDAETFIIEKYKSYMTMLGCRIKCLGNGEVLTAVDIGEGGELITTDDNGNYKVLNSGEISVRRIDSETL